MCGLLYAKVKSSEYVAALDSHFVSALQLMKYRGPDHTGVVRFKNHFFGHVRLSIVDISASSNQPLESEDAILLFNGEIYNHKELDPSSKSDTRTLMRIVSSSPTIESVDNIEGMYAFLYFDKKTETSTVYRDFFGEKPLYCYEDEQVLIISSTLRPIIHLLSRVFGFSLPIDQDAVQEFLLFGFVRDPKTIYAGIRQIRAGHSQSFSNEATSTEHFVRMPQPHNAIDGARYAFNSIDSTDVCPVLLLSSGIDSTYILTQIARSRRQSEYCVYESSRSSNDESKLAIKNLSHVLPDATPIIVRNEMNELDLYRDQIAMLEQPSSQGMQIVNILTGLRRIATEAKVVLTGLGGDELYGGYNSFKYLALYQWIQLLPVRACPGRLRRFKSIRFANEGEHVVPAYYFKYRVSTDAIAFLGNQCNLQKHFDAFRKELNLERLRTDNSYIKLKCCEAFDYMKNQLLRDCDNISMFYGIESRSPLLFPAAVFGPERNRRTFRRDLANQRGVKISRKRGFTLGEDKTKLAGHFKTEVLAINDELQLFPRKGIEAVPPAEGKFELLKRLYVLLCWIQSRNECNLAFDKHVDRSDSG